jgi:hypothetical protein
MEPVQSCSAGGSPAVLVFSVGAGGRLKQRQKSRRDAGATELNTEPQPMSHRPTTHEPQRAAQDHGSSRKRLREWKALRAGSMSLLEATTHKDLGLATQTLQPLP